MIASSKQIEAILRLPPPKRYSHFIKKVVGWGKMWGLYLDGWAMARAPDHTSVLPLWPEREYADRCREGDWALYEPREIPLDDALENMIPMLRDRGIQAGVFFDPDVGSIDCTLDEFERDLRTELRRYS